MARLDVSFSSDSVVALRAIEEVHHHSPGVREVLVGLRLDDEADAPLPALPRVAVDRAPVDLILECLRPLGRERVYGHDEVTSTEANVVQTGPRAGPAY